MAYGGEAMIATATLAHTAFLAGLVVGLMFVGIVGLVLLQIIKDNFWEFLGLIFGLGATLGSVYVLVRFVKWAWQG